MSKRDLRLDIIRIFALFTVVGVHFFLNSTFYSTNVSGLKMYILCIFRSFFIVCVPLFIMLTGYLMNKKELSKKYYKGIIRILIIYLICSVIYHLFSMIYLHNDVTIKSFLQDLLLYQGTKYSWYVEFYICLFLLIPFFNMIFNSIKDKKTANYLLLTLFAMIGIPSCVNHFYHLLPMWWDKLWPLFFYFLGAYLNRYEVKMSTKKNIILLLLVLLIDGSLNYFIFYNSTYLFTSFNYYSSGIIMITSFLTFNLLLKIKINPTKKKTKVLKTLSDAVFGGYLLSCIFDIIIYENFYTRILYAPLIVISVFILSLAVSIIINYIYDIVKSLFMKKI